jgi:hypothetical protein
MKNMSFIRTEKDKITKLKTFCGKQYRDYAARLKNAVNFLVAQICKMNLYVCFPCTFTYECRSFKG